VAVGVTLRDVDVAPRAAGRPAAVAARQERVLGALPAGAFSLQRRYRRLAGLALRIRAEALAALERHPDVRHVYLDGRVHPTLAQGTALVGADTAHALGLRGAGVNVAVLDSGIDTDHPDLSDDLVAEQCFCSGSHPSPQVGCCPGGADTQTGPGAAEDDTGHGTSVAGIITSGGVAAAEGAAPDAGVVALRVIGPTGGSFSDIAAGLDWVLDNRDALADPIRVANLSLGDGGEYADPAGSPCSGSNTANAIAALHAAGVTVFVSSGNDGHDAGISFPACVAEAVSVGGIYDGSFSSVSWCANASCSSILCTDTDVQVDDFVCHTNSGAILDLLAPDWRTTTSALGGGSQAFGGTSAASPYAAAQAALLVEADPGLLPDGIRDALRASGVSVTNPDNGLSFPRSDVGEVVAPLVAVCGNGVLEAGESCDDGNTAPGDCCAADCTFEASGSACDDGDACTTGDACDGSGACQGGAAAVCADGNPCTDDACDPQTGCVFAPNAAPCDDGDACTTGDVCSGGACQPGAPLSCSDGEVCTDDLCDPATGCVFPPNSAACDDGDACTTGDQCSGGVCEGGPPPDCDDGDPCTAESCDAVAGCVSTPVPGCAGAPQTPALPGVGLATLAGLLLAATALALRGEGRSPR